MRNECSFARQLSVSIISKATLLQKIIQCFCLFFIVRVTFIIVYTNVYCHYELFLSSDTEEQSSILSISFSLEPTLVPFIEKSYSISFDHIIKFINLWLKMSGYIFFIHLMVISTIKSIHFVFQNVFFLIQLFCKQGNLRKKMQTDVKYSFLVYFMGIKMKKSYLTFQDTFLFSVMPYFLFY